MSSMPSSRRMSNEIGASLRLQELRRLQGQLGAIIGDAKEEDPVDAAADPDESHSSSSEDSPSPPSSSRQNIGWGSEEADRTTSPEGHALLGEADADALDVAELGGLITQSASYRPRRRLVRVRPSQSSAYALLAGHTKERILADDAALRESAKDYELSEEVRSDVTDVTAPTVCTDGSGDHRSGSFGRKKRRLPRISTYDYLARQDDEEKERRSLRPDAKWWYAVFFVSLMSMLACIITMWAPYPIGARMPTEMVATMPWSEGCQGLQSCICPRETVCADDLISMILLTVARASAWFDYPLYMILFMSKANNLNNFLQKTALRCWINFSDYHRVHSLFGVIVGVESASHTFFHILRWARRQDDIQLLWTSTTGITGLIAILLCPFIVLPMSVPYLKSSITFEWRKGLHYLSVLWAAALMYHAPQRIFWVIGVPVFIYTADYIAGGLFKTHLVESALFHRLGDTSCIISFENPPGFGKQNSAYVYLMLPWLSKCEYHAFTVFPCNKPNHSSICIHEGGDWTRKLMKRITTPTHKPAFVVGPFLSPFSSAAMDSENILCVATGIGITPTVSLIKQYSSTSRRINLIWICRDAGLIEHLLENVEFGSDGYTTIYYTGTRVRPLILKDPPPPNIFIFNGRPNLERTISGIISSIATGEGLPEELCTKVLTRTPAEMRSKLLLEKAHLIYTMDQLCDYTIKASNHYNKGPQPLVDTVNYQGILSTMRHLLGEDCELVMGDITRNFERVDFDNDCQLDRDEFEVFFRLMLRVSNTDKELANVKLELNRMSTCRDMFESVKAISISSEDEPKDEFGIKAYLQGDGKFAARNWNMLYCGGSEPVLDQLKAFKRKFGICLSVEKFDW